MKKIITICVLALLIVPVLTVTGTKNQLQNSLTLEIKSKDNDTLLNKNRSSSANNRTLLNRSTTLLNKNRIAGDYQTLFSLFFQFLKSILEPLKMSVNSINCIFLR